jgi:hypothetical protein
MKAHIGSLVRCVTPSLLGVTLLSSFSTQEPPSPGTLVANQSLAIPSGLPSSFQVRLLLDQEDCVLDLQSHNVRALEYRLYIPDHLGQLLMTAPAAPSTYSGTIAGRNGSRVAGWLSADGLHAVVLDGESAWVVEPEAGAARRGSHLVGRSFDLPALGVALGVAQGTWDDASGRQAPSGAAEGSEPVLIQIAYDADSVYLADHGGDVQAAQAAIEGTMAQSFLLYEHYAGVQYEVSGAVIRTSENDPYIKLSSVNYALTWLDMLSQQWNTPGPLDPERGIPRDLVHLFTGHSGFARGEVGHATGRAVCEMRSAYSVSANQTSSAHNMVILGPQLPVLASTLAVVFLPAREEAGR